MLGHSQQPRPESELLTDLHVYVIPSESWRRELQSALNEVVSQSMSLGFIRVNPDSRLADVRDEMPAQLDGGQLPESFAFLRSVGRCFAKVAKKQENKLKVKYFLPPHAPSQEIFLLPTLTGDDDASQSDSLSLRTDSLASLRSLKSPATTAPTTATTTAPTTATTTAVTAAASPVAATKVPTQQEKLLPSANQEPESHIPGAQTPRQSTSRMSSGSSVTFAKRSSTSSGNRSVVPSPLVIAPLANGSTEHRLQSGKQAEPQENHLAQSVTSLLQDDSSKDFHRGPSDSDNLKEPAVPLDVALATRQVTAARHARLEAERKRAEVIKRVKTLQAKTDSRRAQAKEMWKRRYFEEKQKTPALEESCDSLKVLLAAVRQRSLQKIASSKEVNNDAVPNQAGDNVRVAAIKLEYEMQDLRHQVERTSMQVTAELKLRTQAETELRVLRAELVQHKLNATGVIEPA